MNQSRNSLISQLFKPKQPVNDIWVLLDQYDEMYFSMVATSAEEEDYPIFRVMTSQVKKAIQKQISKLKESVLKTMNDWCAKEVQSIKTEYGEMSKIIKTVP